MCKNLNNNLFENQFNQSPKISVLQKTCKFAKLKNIIAVSKGQQYSTYALRAIHNQFLARRKILQNKNGFEQKIANMSAIMY